jgi:hypothetical protein
MSVFFFSPLISKDRKWPKVLAPSFYVVVLLVPAHTHKKKIFFELNSSSSLPHDVVVDDHPNCLSNNPLVTKGCVCGSRVSR